MWYLSGPKAVGSQSEYPFVFTNLKTGQHYTHIAHTWQRLRKKAGLPHLRLHDLRHTYASMLVNAGESLYVVQQCLGHADGRVTQRYAHLAPQTLQILNISRAAFSCYMRFPSEAWFHGFCR